MWRFEQWWSKLSKGTKDILCGFLYVMQSAVCACAVSQLPVFVHAEYTCPGLIGVMSASTQHPSRYGNQETRE